MSIKKILNIVEQTSADAGMKSGRRDILKSFGAKVAVAALPLAAASIFTPKKAQAKTTDVLYDGLANIIKWKYMKAEFYRLASATALNMYPESAHATILKLAQAEAQHVQTLKDFMMSTAGEVPDIPAYDFTGGRGGGQGPFNGIFSNYSTFLVLAQVFEDTSVRVMKGQFYRFVNNAFIFNMVINMHSVDARNAAHIRLMRRQIGQDVKPWITDNRSDIDNNFVQRSYNSEAIKMQGNVNLTNLNGYSITDQQATQAFDEPINELEMQIIQEPFIVPQP